MKLSMKAALYSALILPGAGYFLVNRKRQGFATLSLAAAGITVIVNDLVNKAMTIAGQLSSGIINISQIEGQLNTTQGYLTTGMISTLTYLIIFLWLVSIFDCYRLGKKQEEVK